MKKGFLKMLVVVGTTVLTFAAHTTAASACIWGMYQPKEPQNLRK